MVVELKHGLFYDRRDGEYNDISLVEISKISVMHDGFFFVAMSFDRVSSE